MNKVIKIIVALGSLLFILNVYADDTYYTSEYGVSMTKEQYDFFSKMYWEGFQSQVTNEIYNKYLSKGLFDREVKTVVKELEPEQGISRSLTHETTAKKLQLSYSCLDGYCTMITSLTWKGIPRVTSYDIIGSVIYGNNAYRIGSLTTSLRAGTNSYTYTNYVDNDSGWGCSLPLPTTDYQMIIYQDVEIYVSGDTTYYSSYQHATSKVTLETSQKFTTGYGGIGGVFFFYGAASGVYDEMAGVNTYLGPDS